MGHDTVSRGRRPGNPDTRGEIIDVARRRFLTAGYPEVTMRAVAEEAGVDVALVGYYFGSKRDLFIEALSDVEAPARRMAEAIAGGDLAHLPERLLGLILRVWDTDEGAAIRAIAAAAPQHPEIADLYARAVERGFIDQVAARLEGPDARRIAAVFTMQISGVAYSRYLLRIEPIASMATGDLIALLAPALTTTLLGAKARA